MKAKRRERHESRPGHLRKLAQLSAQQASVAAEPGPPASHQASIQYSQPTQPVQPEQTLPATSSLEEPQTQPAPPPPPRVKCQLCKCKVALPDWDAHLHDPVHARNARLAGYRQALEEGSQDKFGVSIAQAELDFGIIDLSTLALWPTRENVFYVRLEEGEVTLTNIRLTSTLGALAAFRDTSFNVRFSTALKLAPRVMYAVKVTFDPRGNRGHYDDRVEFSFEMPSNGTKFAITRAVKATVTVQAHRQQLAPTAPYQPPRRRPRGVRGSIVDGERPPHIERHRTAWKYRLPEYPIPADLREALGDGTIDSKVQMIRERWLSLGFSPSTYMVYWEVLLSAEEHQAHKDMENYDQAGVQFAGRVGRLYS
ncbi:hypothetical protein FRC01_008687, partial [Tulasnella sp. 417]